MTATVHVLTTARSDRDMIRGRAAADKVRASGGTAMEAAFAHIDGTFSASAPINRLKCVVERRWSLGPTHLEVKARYGARALRIEGCPLDVAIHHVEHWYRDERRAYQLASLFGRRTQLSLLVLAELRLILRLMRAKGMAGEFRKIVDTLIEPVPMLALVAAE